MPNDSVKLDTVSQGRRNSLDFLRYFFAVLVIVNHSFIFFPGQHSDCLGWVAVNGFFIISGFLITGSWINSRSLEDYLTKRILRIYPAYLVATLLGTLVLGWVGSYHFMEFVHSIRIPSFILKTLFFLTPADYHQLVKFGNQPFSQTINLSIWTIPYEFCCYIMVALLGLLGILKNHRLTLALFATVFLAMTVQEIAFPNFYETHTFLGHSLIKLNQFPRLVTYFLAGMTFFLYKEKIVISTKLFYPALVICCFSLFFQKALWLMPVLGTYVVLYLGFTKILPVQNFGRHGDMSYGVYLYGWPVQKLLMLWFSDHLNPITLIVATTLIASGCAMISWHCIEKPALKLKNAVSKQFGKLVGQRDPLKSV